MTLHSVSKHSYCNRHSSVFAEEDGLPNDELRRKLSGPSGAALDECPEHLLPNAFVDGEERFQRQLTKITVRFQCTWRPTSSMVGILLDRSLYTESSMLVEERQFFSSFGGPCERDWRFFSLRQTFGGDICVRVESLAKVPLRVMALLLTASKTTQTPPFVRERQTTVVDSTHTTQRHGYSWGARQGFISCGVVVAQCGWFLSVFNGCWQSFRSH